MNEELKNIISLDDISIIALGVANIYQLLNIKVPKPIGYATTALTLYSLYTTVQRINGKGSLNNEYTALEFLRV